jgi:hypothetical protein
MDPIPTPGATAEASVRYEPSDLAEIIRDSAGQASRKSPSIPVEIHAPPRLPAFVEPHALAGVVRILVENACRRTDPGLSVTIKANRADEGIAVHVFERGSGDGEGAHVDLARALVALHGGVLWSEPLPAGGAKCSFVIPQHPPELGPGELSEAVRSLEELGRMDVPHRPVVPEEPSSEESALLGDRLDETEAILDVTDIPDELAAPSAPVEPPPEVDLTASADEPDRPAEPEPVLEPVPTEAFAEAQEAPVGGEAPVEVGKGKRWWKRAWRPGVRPAHDAPPEAAPSARVAIPDLEQIITEVTSEEGRTAGEPAAPIPIEELTAAPEEQASLVDEPPSLAPPVEASGGRARAVRAVPSPFVPDPLHPATQALRDLMREEDLRP